MGFHFLPGNEFVFDEAKTQLLERLHRWYDDWLTSESKPRLEDLVISPASKAAVTQLVGKKYGFWNKAELEQRHCYLGVSWGEGSIKTLVERISKHSVVELEQSKLDWFELAKASSHELLELLGLNLIREEPTVNHFLNELESLDTESEHFLGAICRINLGFGSVEIYIPNLVLKHLSLAGRSDAELTQHAKVKLTPRTNLFNSTEVLIKAKIDGFKLSIKDLNTLQKGDVITTRENRDNQISLFVNRSPVYVGKSTLGKKGIRRAIKIS